MCRGEREILEYRGVVAKRKYKKGERRQPTHRRKVKYLVLMISIVVKGFPNQCTPNQLRVTMLHLQEGQKDERFSLENWHYCGRIYTFLLDLIGHLNMSFILS